ncbi:MAG: NADPH-dependent FMN reductase [Nesterenkonia sp.]|uniref:NADPH-dependent FMN reductase n=1 Tax=Nesterenkonia marinintestina TaxID=2979865 RepID=UPI0021C0A521|nr:NADPH-dependent FMN reductase [Nesterenkonia sp. GX14115]MDO5492735.1 NADPH-dependent FMN reductase [Nesterenkonia sp.]
MTTIGYFVGSWAEGSVNRKLARTLVEQAPEDVEMRDLDISGLPLYGRHLDEDFPQVMQDFKDRVEAVDGLLIVTPEHNQSFPAAVKNAVDILTRPGGTSVLRGRPVTIAGASPGRFGTISSQSQLRQFLPMLGVRFMGTPNLAVGGAKDVFDDDGVADEQTAARARKFVAAFADFIRA